MDYETLRPGTLQLVPPDHYRPVWEADYVAMQSEMFYGEVPGFDELMSVVTEFGRQFNREHSL